MGEIYLNVLKRKKNERLTLKLSTKKEWRGRVKLSRMFKRSIFFTQFTSQFMFKGMKSILILWNTPLPEFKCFILFTVINFKVHLFNIIDIGTCTIKQLVILLNQNSVSYLFKTVWKAAIIGYVANKKSKDRNPLNCLVIVNLKLYW